jgi:putative tryptophan/tyrosine transport system substrate-binding protein
MKRREIIALMGGAAVAWPLAARAQQPDRMRRLGMLMNFAESDPVIQASLAAFLQRVRDLGWVEGRNIQIEYRWTVSSADRARTFAAELVAMKPDVILASGGTSLSALLQETGSVPIVFVGAGDQFIASLARPGGNATGFTAPEATIGTKWLEMLKEIAPGITRVVILSSDNPASSVLLPPLEAAAVSLGVQATVAHFRDAAEIERAIGASAREPNVGLLVLGGSLAAVHRDLIIALAARYRLPAIYAGSTFPRSGGLLSYGEYGIERIDNYRKAAEYVDRILRGEKPSDLPVQAPTKYELVINLKTAKALGLTVPLALQVQADEVIE